jgi:hypothetical protein
MSANNNSLLIGWASADITPDRPVNLMGQFNARIAKKVLDPVTVTALAVSSKTDGREDCMIWVSCDLAVTPVRLLEMCREKLSRKISDFPTEKLIMGATHTHTAPDMPPSLYELDSLPEELRKDLMMPEEYMEFAAERISSAAAESWRARKPGLFSYGFGYAVTGHNRRAVYLKDFSEDPNFKENPGFCVSKNAKMYGNTADPLFSHIEGGEDSAAQFLFTYNPDKKLTGAVINIACTSQETEGISEVSADFWHETRCLLRKQHGEGLFVLPQCSAAGDLSPHLMYDKKAHQRMLELKGVSSRMEIASRIKAAFDGALTWASKDMRDSAVLRHSARTVMLPRRKITADDVERNKKALENFSGPKLARLRCERTVRCYNEQEKIPFLPAEIHIVRLGDIAFATNPFELFLDFGVRIRARSPAVQTFVAQLTGDYRECGYLPTERAERGGGYSACVYCNRVGHEGGDKLAGETLGDLSRLWTD